MSYPALIVGTASAACFALLPARPRRRRVERRTRRVGKQRHEDGEFALESMQPKQPS